MTRTQLDPRLYFVAGKSDAGDHEVASLMREAVDGGATLLQLREKTMSTGEFIESARAISNAIAGSGVPLLINDRVDVALAAGVDGVHIGQTDMTPEDARRLLGAKAIIGLTVRDREEIDAAPIEVLDYLSIGGVFETSSKNNTREPVGLSGLRELARHCRTRCELPLTAIAGIGTDQIAPVMACGVDGVAIISAISKASSPRQAALELRQLVDRNLATGAST